MIHLIQQVICTTYKINEFIFLKKNGEIDPTFKSSVQVTYEKMGKYIQLSSHLHKLHMKKWGNISNFQVICTSYIWKNGEIYPTFKWSAQVTYEKMGKYIQLSLQINEFLFLDENGFSRRLPQRKWFLGDCHTENGFQRLPTRKLVFRRLPQRKSFLGTCHTENDF